MDNSRPDLTKHDIKLCKWNMTWNFMSKTWHIFISQTLFEFYKSNITRNYKNQTWHEILIVKNSMKFYGSSMTQVLWVKHDMKFYKSNMT